MRESIAIGAMMLFCFFCDRRDCGIRHSIHEEFICLRPLPWIAKQ